MTFVIISDDVNRLRQVLETVHGYMRSSLLVYRLAHEVRIGPFYRVNCDCEL